MQAALRGPEGRTVVPARFRFFLNPDLTSWEEGQGEHGQGSGGKMSKRRIRGQLTNSLLQQ